MGRSGLAGGSADFSPTFFLLQQRGSLCRGAPADSRKTRGARSPEAQDLETICRRGLLPAPARWDGTFCLATGLSGPLDPGAPARELTLVSRSRSPSDGPGRRGGRACRSVSSCENPASRSHQASTGGEPDPALIQAASPQRRLLALMAFPAWGAFGKRPRSADWPRFPGSTFRSTKREAAARARCARRPQCPPAPPPLLARQGHRWTAAPWWRPQIDLSGLRSLGLPDIP